MTASIVPPLVPRVVLGGSGAGPAGRVRRPLPVPVLDIGLSPATGLVYALSAVDKSGRVADRGVVRALGWGPGFRLDIRVRAGVVVLRPAGNGVYRVDDRGYLLLPLAVRRWCGLGAGDRLLFAGDRSAGVLVAYPLAVLDRLLAGVCPAGGGGDAA